MPPKINKFTSWTLGIDNKKQPKWGSTISTRQGAHYKRYCQF